MSPGDELRCLLRLPFDALAAVLGRIKPDFAWQPVTARRIRKLLFRINNVQLFTCLPVPQEERGKLLGLIRCLVSVPFGDGRGRFRLIADALNVRVDARHRGDDDVQTLLVVCRVGGRAALSINMYEKDAKVAADNRASGAGILGLADEAGLRNAIRLDLTLHEPALRELFREAGIAGMDGAAMMAASFVKAVRRLERGKGRSGKACLAWLLDYAFEQCLPLLKLLSYRPALLNKANRVLAVYNPTAAAVFKAWWGEPLPARGRRTSFCQYAMRHPTHRLTREQARKARAKLLTLGIDPDIPADVYETFFAQTYVWEMTRGERTTFCRALEAGDAEVIARLMAGSRSRSVKPIERISSSVRRMLRSAEVPAVEISASLRPGFEAPLALVRHGASVMRCGKLMTAVRVTARRSQPT